LGAGLGYARWTLGFNDSAQSKAQGREEIEKSIALAPGLAEAYTLRGSIRLRVQYDWEGARADLDHALALS